jgi:hypothetical protein
MVITDLQQRVELYLSELCEKGGIPKKEGNWDNLPLDKRAYQLGINYVLFSLLHKPQDISLERIAGFRRAVDALGVGRDVKCAEAYSEEERVEKGWWTSEQLELVRQGYREERALFEKYFPISQFPSIYVTNN